MRLQKTGCLDGLLLTVSGVNLESYMKNKLAFHNFIILPRNFPTELLLHV